MRTFLILASLGVLSALGACASTGTPSSSTASTEYDRLLKTCTDRGGILKPIPGANSPNDQANYACEISGVSPRS